MHVPARAEAGVDKDHGKSLGPALLGPIWQVYRSRSWKGGGLWGVPGMSLGAGVGLGSGAQYE